MPEIIFGRQPSGTNRVNRGGSWRNTAQNCRSANRNRNTPGNTRNNLGFRLALSSCRCVWSDAGLNRLSSRSAAQATDK